MASGREQGPHLGVGSRHDLFGLLGNPRIAGGQHALQQRTHPLLAVIGGAGQGQIGEAAEVGICRVEEVVEASGMGHIAAVGLGFGRVPKLGDPAVVTELHRGHRHRIELVDGIELGVLAPGLGQEPLDARHIAGRQIGIRFDANVAVGGSQAEASDPGALEMDLTHPVAQVQFGAALLDVIEDGTGEPAVGGTLEQVELGGLGFRGKHHEDGEHAAG